MVIKFVVSGPNIEGSKQINVIVSDAKALWAAVTGMTNKFEKLTIREYFSCPTEEEKLSKKSSKKVILPSTVRPTKKSETSSTN